MVINAPSLANIPITEFGEQLAQLYEGGCRWFHVDLMDGHYVPNLLFPVDAVGQIKAKYPDCVMEVHMMVDDPAAYIRRMKAAGCDMLSFHFDATSFVRRTLGEIRAAGMKAGVVLNPSQRIDILEPVAGLFDYVVFMSVEPGFAGQKYLPGSTQRLAELAAFRKEHGLDFRIVVDGGTHYGILQEIVENGADAVVTNIYTVFNQPEGIVASCRKFAAEAENYTAKL